ncbi:MAG TPA: VOC family protein [Pirellulales bacterium]|nr:VOC family protein [Pirellulales bacterium]
MAVCHFTLATTDIERTKEFFASALGWRPIHRPNNIPYPAAWLDAGPGMELHLIEVDDFRASPFEREYGRHIAVAFPHAEFPALKERLVRHGAELFAADRPTPFDRFFFRDPNGYVFEIVEAERRPEA